MANSTDFLLAVEGPHRLVRRLQGRRRPHPLRRQDELRVIIGPNGAGKTTLLDLICGRTRATDGSIKFKDQEITGLRSTRSCASASAASSRRRRSTRTSPCSRTSRCRYRAAAASSARCSGSAPTRSSSACRTIAAMIFLEDQLDRLAETLSHGQKQWLEIGMLLIQDPELLMLDEPVAGMSVRSARKTAELLNEISKNRAVIVIEHDMEFVKKHRAPGHGAAPGQDAGRGQHGDGAGRSEGHRSLSRSLARARAGHRHARRSRQCSSRISPPTARAR